MLLQYALYKELNVALDDKFVQVLKSMFPHDESLSLHEPLFSGNEHIFIQNCLESTFVSSVGKYVDQFESMLADYTGAKHVVAVVNGTAALQIALILAGIKAGDEVLIPALSFVATANAVIHCGAKPHFIDSHFETMGIDSEALSEHLNRVAEFTSCGVRNKHTGRRIAAIVPMHTYGHPVEMESLLQVANRYKLPVVEDAAESLGSLYQGQHTGTLGLLGTLSFNGNKIITTGGGGAILTNDIQLARLAKHLTTTAKVQHRWEFAHDHVAWNYRMPNLNAALGCAQLECLPEFLLKKRALAMRYLDIFQCIDELSFMKEPANTRSNYWLNTICLKQPNLTLRDQILAKVNDAGYQCRPAWTLLSKLPMYVDCPRASLTIAERLESSIINVPSSVRLEKR